MKRLISALVLMSVAGLGVAGCGGDDDDDSSNSTGGTGGTGATGATGGEAPTTNAGETGSGGTPDDGNVACDPTQDGVCQNETDCPAVSSGDARAAAETCGTGECLGKESQCSIDCIKKAVDMTSECADCYGAIVACTAKNCFAECVTAPESDECKTCQVEKGCRDAFNTCSGLPE